MRNIPRFTVRRTQSCLCDVEEEVEEEEEEEEEEGNELKRQGLVRAAGLVNMIPGTKCSINVYSKKIQAIENART